MKVKDLIKELEKIENKEQEVLILDEMDNEDGPIYSSVNYVSDNVYNQNVVILSILE